MKFCINLTILLAIKVAFINGKSSCSIFPEQPMNGKRFCNLARRHCSFQCNKGYELVGFRNTECYNGRWTQPSPKCIDPALICKPALEEPLNADAFCSNGSILGSLCEFECFYGFTQVGEATSTCIQTDEGVKWSHPAPTCEPEQQIAEEPIPQQGTCDVLPQPFFSDMICSNGNALGSVCEYECFSGFTLEGSSATTCMKTGHGSKWNNSPPICRPGIFES